MGNVIAAIIHAEKIGRPLTAAVTINVGHTDWVDVDEISERWTRHFLKAFHRWLRSRWPHLGSGAFVWGIEHPEGYQPNVHWSVHIPAAVRRPFEGWLRTRVRAVFGDFEARAIHIHYPEKIGDRIRMAKYSVKGTKKAVHAHYRLSKEWSHQGVIAGKRCGHSECLGPTEIKRFEMKAAA